MREPRQPDVARDEDIAAFTKAAAAKYDKGQLAAGTLLDETVTFDALWKTIANLRRAR